MAKKQKRIYIQKSPLEAYTRKLIEDKLSKLNYITDELDDNCNVFRERAKMEYQDKLLDGKNPDFIIYKSGTDIPIAIIEAKRMGVTLEQAISQAIDYYATPLNVPTIFVFNGVSFYACSKEGIPLKIDKIEISDFVNEKTLLNLINNNFEIETIPSGLMLTKEELLNVFKRANNLLRKAGLRDGYERFSVFADLLFLKLKNDFDDYGIVSTSKIDIDRVCNWEKLMNKTPKYMGSNFSLENSEVKSYLEDSIKPKLKEKYGDVFETSLNINDESILIELLELIDDIDFTAIDSDIKGDAFEFFLRNVTNGNKDLGEYYTPRHIAKMIVGFLNPKVGDKIYDSCCGTGGFLLECFKYLKKNSDTTNEEDQKTIREKSIYGRELTSTARISKMNMILFGDGHSNIIQMDCLSKPIKEEFDIAISNIPYSQKVEHGNLYPFPSDSGDSVFVQHLWQSVKKGGQMAVIIPDTFLYDEGEVQKCREWILNDASDLVIVSLPRGVFNPYTPTKTSVLIVKKRRAEEVEKNYHFENAYMYVVRNDGFELGAKRRAIKGMSDCNHFLINCHKENKALRITNSPNSVEVDYTQLKKNKFNLFPFCYMEHLPPEKEVESLALLSKHIKERDEKFDYNEYKNKSEECAILSVTKNGIYINEICSVEEMQEKSQKYKKVEKGDVAYNPHRINIGSVGVVPKLHQNMFVPQIYPVFKVNENSNISPYFIVNLLKKKEYQIIINDYCLGGARANLKFEWLSKIKFIEPSKDKEIKFEEYAKKLEKAHENYIKLLEKINTL